MEENQEVVDTTETEVATEKEVVVVAAEEVAAPESEETHDIIAREIKGRERDESGKFVKKEEPEKTVAPEATPEKTEEAPRHNPFSAWKKEAQEKLSALPDDVKSFIVEREGQFHRGIEQYKEEAYFARNIKKAVAPHAEYLQQLGVTPDAALSHLVASERKLRTGTPEQKAEMFHQMARDYGVDLGEISQLPFDPEMFRLKQQVERMQNQLQTPYDSTQSAEDDQVLSEIDAFAQSHEHFEQVREDMALLLQGGKATGLDDAYAKAIRLNDGLFEKTQAQQLEASRRQEALKANQAAKAAKAAAVSVKGAPTGVAHITPATTEDAVRLAMRRHIN